MDNFYKFPSTPHLQNYSSSLLRSEKVITPIEYEVLSKNNITIEEKIDGANLGISFSETGDMLLQNRGNLLSPPFIGQWQFLEQWINHHEDSLFEWLDCRYILFGEWCYAKHSVKYTKLPDWFIAFDVYDKQSQVFLSVELRNDIIKRCNVARVPHLFYGKVVLTDIDNFFDTSKFGFELSEGLYLRYDNDGKNIVRAKHVRKGFRQNIEVHWQKRHIIPNSVERSARLDIRH